MHYIEQFVGAALISPSGDVLVCRGANYLELTCTVTTETLLQWSLLLVNNEGISRIYTRHITSIDMSQQISQLTVNSSVFHFSRTSLQGDLPLTSSLITNSISLGLEGTVVNCTEVGITMNSSSIVIHFVQQNPDSPLVAIRNNSVRFSRHNVSVILDWVPEFNVSYSFSAVPSAQIIKITGNTEAEARIIVSYNVLYNVSIVATQCGLDSVPTNVQLRYGEYMYTCILSGKCNNITILAHNAYAASCDYPLEDGFDHDSIQVAGYRVPALQGTIVRFSCPTGQVLKGLNMTMCTSNGMWEPDPLMGEMKCECKREYFEIHGYLRHSCSVCIHPCTWATPCKMSRSIENVAWVQGYVYLLVDT